MKAARVELLEFTVLVRGFGAVGVLGPCGALPWLPRLLAAFKTDYPDVQLTLFERTNEQLVDLVRDAELHAAFMLVPSESQRDTGGVIIHPMYSRELVLIVPAGHKFAGRESVTMEELSGEPLLLPRTGEPTRTVVDRAFQIHGVEPTIGCEVTDPLTLAGLAAEGLGIAISAPGIARRTGAPVSTVRLDGVTMIYSVALAWAERGARTRAVVTFVEFAENWMQDWLRESVRSDDPAIPHPRSGLNIAETLADPPIVSP
jgi:DNA-binding transcriptional LysR family regulator